MLTGVCHCGAVHITIPRKPRTVTDCPCSASAKLRFISASAFLSAAKFVILSAHLVKCDMGLPVYVCLELELPSVVVDQPVHRPG